MTVRSWLVAAACVLPVSLPACSDKSSGPGASEDGSVEMDGAIRDGGGAGAGGADGGGSAGGGTDGGGVAGGGPDAASGGRDAGPVDCSSAPSLSNLRLQSVVAGDEL